MSARPAGHHARRRTRFLARRAIVAIAAALAVMVAVVLASGWPFEAVLAVELAVIGVITAIDRLEGPKVERWSRGARGEEEVGRVLEELEPDGWLTVHDAYTGRGNIDTVLVGPGGLFALEVKSHGGKVHPDRIPERMLKQAYAEKMWLADRLGHSAEPLLVFSRAYLLGRSPVVRRRGVTILPARMLVKHLRRRRRFLSADDVRRLHSEILAAVA